MHLATTAHRHACTHTRVRAYTQAHTHHLLLLCSTHGRSLPLTQGSEQGHRRGSRGSPWEHFHRQRCPGSLFTHGAQKTCSNLTLRRRWRAGSGQLCLPPCDSSQGGLAWPAQAPGKPGLRGGVARRGHRRAAKNRGCSQGITTTLGSLL